MTTTTLIGALLLLGWGTWALRRLVIFGRRCPPLCRVWGTGAATAAAERRLAHRLQTRQIDAAAYRSALRALTDRRPTATRRT
jgi:hypothetical protein